MYQMYYFLAINAKSFVLALIVIWCRCGEGPLQLLETCNVLFAYLVVYLLVFQLL
jgi:hypothetical protein